jgi:hypothetical protein
MASSLKDIQYALEGERKERKTKKKEYIPAPPNKKFPDETIGKGKNVIFKLVNSNRQGGVYIPYTDHVINPATITEENKSGNVEMIRLLTGVPTIWVKEQKDLTPEFIKQNRRSIEFPRGNKWISIPDWDKTAIEFMRVCRHNVGNPLRKSGSKFEFFEYDAEKIAQWEFEQEALEADMIVIAKTQSIEKMMKHAPFIGISMVDEYGLPRGEMSIRKEYMIAAKRNPELFRDTVDSEEVDVQFMIHKLIQEMKIDLGRESNKAFWSKGGELICFIPQNEKPLFFLTKFALTPSEEGRKFKEQIKQRST